MLKTRLLHPEILAALGEEGRRAQVLIADGNYPLLTRSSSTAQRVYLNLAPDVDAVGHPTGGPPAGRPVTGRES